MGLTRMWDMTQSYVCHDSFMRVSWLILMCDMTHSYVRHDSFLCETWVPSFHNTHTRLTHVNDTASHACVMTHSWLIHACFMTHSNVRHESRPFTTLTHVSHMWMTQHAHMNESWHTYKWVITHVWMSHVSHTNESHLSQDSHIWITQITRANSWLPMFVTWKTKIDNIEAMCCRDIDTYTDIEIDKARIFLWTRQTKKKWHTHPYCTHYRVAKTHRIP